MKPKKNFYYVAQDHDGKWKVFCDQAGKQKPNLEREVIYRPYSNEKITYKGTSFLAASGYADAANGGAKIDMSAKSRPRRTADKKQLKLI